MGIFDAINVAENAMSVHRFRSEIAAQNVANINTPGWKRKEVELRGSNFASALEGARAGDPPSLSPAAVGGDAHAGAVQIANVTSDVSSPFDERQQALLATTDMMRAKSAFELSSKAATLLKSMALSSLEIGRGS